MRVLEGEVGLFVPSVRKPGRGGRTLVPALDIGRHQLRRVLLPDHLRQHLAPGRHARVLVGIGLSHGVITRPFVAAVESGGHKGKTGSVLAAGVLKSALYCGLAILVLGRFPALAGIACGAIVAYYLKDSLDLARF
jgi:hypothetical protein